MISLISYLFMRVLLSVFSLALKPLKTLRCVCPNTYSFMTLECTLENLYNRQRIIEMVKFHSFACTSFGFPKLSQLQQAALVSFIANDPACFLVMPQMTWFQYVKFNQVFLW